MLIKVENIETLELKGVYKIKNIKTEKFYIGSTIDSFKIRLKAHREALVRGTHKNRHLQNAWNKYGSDAFVFEIVEICEETICRQREQYYLDLGPWNKMYNINTLATGPCLESETIEKQVATRKVTNAECLDFYNKVKSGKLNIEEVPEKHRRRIKNWLTYEPWNKGKHYTSTDHLKVPHKKSDRSNVKNTFREKYPVIYVYDCNKNFLGSYRSAKDLEELSENENFPIKSRFKGTTRMGIPVKKLQSVNINKAARTGKTYKNLYFFYQPLHPGMDDVNEPKSVKSWNANAEVTEETKESSAPYSVETETTFVE